ncbi:hypothetical protein SAMN04489710_1299 [Paracidovorax konjaci]|uniref:Uncharacterized protein n=2 Tax=Paracidovorax konjaci TaxID=32040 RepID=A0A1I1ZL45_9BURK|nr:hypothetical protein SAMN04489710_1299 [Paracidovorax konjaci]
MLLSFSANAVSGFSRACSMAEINGPVLYAALNFFSMLGMPKYLIEQVYQASDTQRGSYWVHESMTADVIFEAPRYYLFSESRIYKKPDGPVFGGSTAGFKYLKEYKSPWTSMTMHPDIVDNNKLGNIVSILNIRRLGFFSRAGNEQILEQYGDTQQGAFVVYGQHYYHDPATRRTVSLPISKATNCNLGEWGWSWF